MKSSPILEAVMALQKWGLVVKSNDFGSYAASGHGVSILFVVDIRDGLIRFDITRDARPRHQVDVFAIIEHFNPGLVGRFLSHPYYPSATDVVRFCVENLDARMIGTILNGDDILWLDLHQKSLQWIKARTQGFYEYVSGIHAGEVVDTTRKK